MLKPNGKEDVNDITSVKIGALNKRHMLLGYEDGRVLIADVEDPTLVLLE